VAQVWLYDHESRELSFPRSFADFPAHLRPLILGSFFSRGGDLLLLDLRSCERAVLAIPFFDQQIPRAVARVVGGEVVNKLFPVAGNERLMPHDLFDNQEPLPQIERVPVHYYEEGIDGFALFLRVRQMMARQHPCRFRWFQQVGPEDHRASRAQPFDIDLK
jgi:hypothetical protein